MDHPKTDYRPMSNGQGAELIIFWKENNPPGTIKQVLKPSETVYVDIMSEFDMNMKKMKLTVDFIQIIESNFDC